MDNQPKRPINLNLKQIQTVDIGKQKQSESSSARSIAKQNKTTDQSKKSSNDKSNSGQLNRTNVKQASTKSAASTNQSTSKRLKVPFDLTPTANQTKAEFKYSKENANLRVINQVDGSRKELLQGKIGKSNDRKADKIANDRTDRSNLKSIDTSTNRTSTTNRAVTSKSSLDKLTDTSTTTSRLGDVYLKYLPDQFNYLDDGPCDLESLQLNLHLNNKRPNSMSNQTNHSNNRQFNHHAFHNQQFNHQFNQTSDQRTDSPSNATNNLSLQFLKEQKASLEIEELINFQIKTDDEKCRIKNVVDSLMKALIEFKRSTYTAELADDLDDNIKKIVKNS